jgi:WhiB family redox-sensing transcriptional regulator
MTNELWRLKRACKNMSVNTFFPQNRREFVAAKKICAQCPVSAQCLQYAVENMIAFGIWGGTSEKERNGLIREFAKINGIDHRANSDNF